MRAGQPLMNTSSYDYARYPISELRCDMDSRGYAQLANSVNRHLRASEITGARRWLTITPVRQYLLTQL